MFPEKIPNILHLHTGWQRSPPGRAPTLAGPPTGAHNQRRVTEQQSTKGEVPTLTDPRGHLKMTPRTAQDAPRTPQDAPGRPQDVSKTAPRRPPDRRLPRCPQDVPRTASDAPPPQTPPRTSPEAPRRPHDPPEIPRAPPGTPSGPGAKQTGAKQTGAKEIANRS